MSDTVWKWVAAVVVAVLTVSPLVVACFVGPVFGVKIPAANFSELDFLAVAIALAAYVGAVRIALIQRLGSNSQSRLLSKIVVLSLIPADFNLILSALIMAAKVFCFDAFGQQRIEEWFPLCPFFFVCAVCYLALQHLVAWVLSVLKYFDVF